MQSLLTPFETYMLLDETPSHPMEFFYRLRFDGPLDPGSVKDAAARAVARHPLLGSRIEWGRAARPRFLPLEQRRIAAEIIQTATVAECESLPRIPPLDLSAGPLVRIVAVAGPQIDGSPSGPRELIAQFHHVACDGLGALAFLADLLELIASNLLDRAPDLEPIDPSRLARRGRYGLDAWKLLRSLPAQARGLEGVWKFIRHRPGRFPPDVGATGVARELAAVSSAYSHVEAAALRRTAAAASLSLNEIATAALFTALAAEVLPPASTGGSAEVIRLSIPMNLRQAADRRMPAANVVSMVFLDRTAAQIADREGLLRSIHEEMQLIKDNGLGMTFIHTLAAARCGPGGIAALVRSRSTAATALFTNLGRIFRRADRRLAREGRTATVSLGPVRLVAVDGLAPLRRGTPLAMAAIEYGGSLGFTIRFDPTVISGERACRIRDGFDVAMRRSLVGLRAEAVV
jgi:hypothetical protein